MSILLALLAALIGVPLLMQPGTADAGAGAEQLIIITPHNEQIRHEFELAFESWHLREHGAAVNVVWSVPGGTSEIRKMLIAQWESALEAGEPVGGNADLVFGGGSYEHELLKREVTVTVAGEERSASISAPIELDRAWLEETYGDNRVGDLPIYDEDRHWFGTALSGFGIVYNRDVLARLGLADPTAWHDLCDPALRGWLALVNPGQSGSVTTAFDAILQRRGWAEGWQILRRAAANSRYFSASALKPPIDVAHGDAAMGVCIDFYGRYEVQALAVSGSPDRLGYVDPPGETLIDPDPISMLANAPRPELAERFVRFALSPAGQALWQFRADDRRADGLGPDTFELRRLPVLRSIYRDHFDRLVDRVNPYEIARPVDAPNRYMRAFIAPLFAALAMDCHDELVGAWTAIVTHPAYPTDAVEPVTAADVTDPVLRAMLERFDSFPAVPAPAGPAPSLADPDDLQAIRDGWLRDGWAADGLWHPQDRGGDALQRRLVRHYRALYAEVAAMRNTGSIGVARSPKRRLSLHSPGRSR